MNAAEAPSACPPVAARLAVEAEPRRVQGDIDEVAAVAEQTA